MRKIIERAMQRTPVYMFLATGYLITSVRDVRECKKHPFIEDLPDKKKYHVAWHDMMSDILEEVEDAEKGDENYFIFNPRWSTTSGTFFDRMKDLEFEMNMVITNAHFSSNVELLVEHFMEYFMETESNLLAPQRCWSNFVFLKKVFGIKKPKEIMDDVVEAETPSKLGFVKRKELSVDKKHIRPPASVEDLTTEALELLGLSKEQIKELPLVYNEDTSTKKSKK